MWKFKTISDAQISMKKLKEERPKAWPHFYIWNTKTNKKIKYEEPFDDFGWWGS